MRPNNSLEAAARRSGPLVQWLALRSQYGNTYDVTAELTAPDRISARVFRGVPLFGRTEILIRDPQLSFDGRC